MYLKQYRREPSYKNPRTTWKGSDDDDGHVPMSVWRRGGGSSSSSRAKPSSGANSDSEGVTSLQGKSSAPITPELARREKLELINEKNKGLGLLEQHKELKEVAEEKTSSWVLTRDGKFSLAEDKADLTLEDEITQVLDGLWSLRRLDT